MTMFHSYVNLPEGKYLARNASMASLTFGSQSGGPKGLNHAITCSPVTVWKPSCRNCLWASWSKQITTWVVADFYHPGSLRPKVANSPCTPTHGTCQTKTMDVSKNWIYHSITWYALKNISTDKMKPIFNIYKPWDSGGALFSIFSMTYENDGRSRLNQPPKGAMLCYVHPSLLSTDRNPKNAKNQLGKETYRKSRKCE